MTEKNRLDELLERLRVVEAELAQELEKTVDEKRKQFHYRLNRGRVIFDRQVKRLQQAQRLHSWDYIRQARFSTILSAPVIYGMIVPLLFLDVSLTLYQHICFRIYGIPRVKRQDYFVIDRHQLGYLNLVQKINCVYCGYGNGLMAYGREITARTEQYWCPIKHARKLKDSHGRYGKFFEYGDADNWKQHWADLRKDWADEETPVRFVDPSQAKKASNPSQSGETHQDKPEA